MMLRMGQVSLTRGFVATVDDRDVEWLSEFNWCTLPKSTTVYAQSYTARPNRRTIRMHIEIWERHNGSIPEGFTVDHQNRDGLDNRLENLRLATPAQQAMNVGPNRNTSSQYKGVSWRRNGSKWVAQIQLDGRKLSVGYFDSEIEAAVAYDMAALEHYDADFSYLNLLDHDFPTDSDVVISWP